MEQGIKKIAEALRSWISVVVIIVGGIFSCANAYFQIHEMQRDIDDIKQQSETRWRAHEGMGDKRYDAMLEIIKRHEDFGLYHEKRILELEKDDAYNKGLVDGLKLKK